MNKHSLSAEARRKTILSIVLGVICVIYVLPVLTVVINSFKLNTYVKTDTFALPNAESFAGWANFIKGLTFGNYPFLKSAGYSLFITIVSTALILLCTSMAAWYIARVDSKFCRMVYYLCVFSMVVPFQMVMFTLSKTADTLKLNTPWTIPIIYLGFGAGLAIFMFVGFIKSIPLEIEEAAAIDGSNGQVLSGPDLVSRGFVYVRESEELMDGARVQVEMALDRSMADNMHDWASVKSRVREALSSYIYRKTKRSPMILPILMEV